MFLLLFNRDRPINYATVLSKLNAENVTKLKSFNNVKLVKVKLCCFFCAFQSCWLSIAGEVIFELSVLGPKFDRFPLC